MIYGWKTGIKPKIMRSLAGGAVPGLLGWIMMDDGVGGGMYIYVYTHICMTESLRCATEIDTTNNNTMLII